MAATMTVISRTPGLLVAGNEQSAKLEYGVISFDAGSTGAAGELPISMTYVKCFQLTAVAAAAGTGPDTDQLVWVDETEDGTGGFLVPAATGTVSIGIVGASPVAMKYFYLAIGW